MASLADAFNPEDRVSVKYSDFYRIIENSCSQAAALMYIKNAVMAGVPNCYIRSMLDGQKHWEETDISDYLTLGERDNMNRIESYLQNTEDNNGEN